MSDFGHHPKFETSLADQSHRWAMETAARESADSNTSTRELTARLVDAAVAAEEREAKMLFWARVAALAGIVAVVAAVVGIVVTVAH